MPSNFAPAGDWRQTFYNIKTGEVYFCSCFRKAIEKNPEPKVSFKTLHPHVKYALDNNSYMDNICHLCTKTEPPQNPFSHSFASIYGCYIYKAYFEMDGINSENYAQIGRDAENAIREKVGYPLIGERWIQETYLYKRIKQNLPEVEIIHHGRPDFLGKQEYDIWIPEYKIAVEYQGIQHYKAIKNWGGEEGLQKRQSDDKKKYKISVENGVTLIYAKGNYNYAEILQKIKAIIKDG
jgi:hypothetical protein